MAQEEWITPKTNWKATDFINYADYNRIVNNVAFLRRWIYSQYKIDYENMTYSSGYTDYPYADMLNAIENNLDRLNNGSFRLNIGSKTAFVDNGKGLDYNELNRLESAILALYNRITVGREALQMMTFTFGVQKGFRG